MKEIKERTLSEGENTGHAHRVKVAVMEREDGVRLFEGETEVTHEEHKVIKLPNRQWASDRVLEFDHESEMERRVKD